MEKSSAARSIRYRYIIGLSAIALLVSASYLTLQRVVSEQRNYARLVNMAGHQSGLINRIAYFASLMAITGDENEFEMARAQVGRTINKVVRNQRMLREGDAQEGIPRVSSERLQTIFEDPMVGLDLALERFLERARTAYHGDLDSYDTGSPAYLFLTSYGPHVLEPLLDAAVEEYERIAHAAILEIERIELVLWLAALVALLLEAMLIFRPLERRIHQSFRNLEDTVEELTTTRERLLGAQELALVGDWQWDFTRRRMTWSEQVYRICGVDADGFRHTPADAMQLIHPRDRLPVLHKLREARDTGNSASFEYRIRRPDGSERRVLQKTRARRDAAGRVTALWGTIQDITDLHELSARLEKLSRNIPGFIYQFHLGPDGRARFPYASRGILEVYGIDPQAVAEDAAPLFALLHREDLERVRGQMRTSAANLDTWYDQYRVQHPLKGEIWVESHATPERLPDGSTLWHGYLRDITNKKRNEDQIRELALFDPLTGLANRRLLKDRMEQTLAAVRRNRQFGALLMLDLDNFKTLNDTLGHDVGDALLIEVSRRLEACVRESDIIARLGGDEFVALLEGMGQNDAVARDKAREIAEKMRHELNRPYLLDGARHPYRTSVSIGIAMFEVAASGVDEVLKQADVALFEAKECGRNRVCFFTRQRQATINSRTAMADALRRALDRGELSLYYQPQVSPEGRLTGAEALVRWFPSDRSPVSPERFIPVAEETGLIVPLGEWVLDTACRQLRILQDRPLPDDFAVSVNISARQFSDERFLDKVRQTLTRTGAEVRRLKFELTESSLFEDLPRAVSMLESLRGMGVRIELDDFGTGYSSLTSLKRLPLDTLKLDGTLVRDAFSEGSSAAILHAAVAMARALGLEVVAEGVETPEQAGFLIDEGCDCLQGLLFAAPMGFDKLLARVDRREWFAIPAHPHAGPLRSGQA